jgi:SOS response regulatory protein OraA/RecX
MAALLRRGYSFEVAQAAVRHVPQPEEPREPGDDE